MDNKLNNMLNEFIENEDVKNEKELEEKLQKFIEKYNNGEIEYENTPLDDAYELLEKAENTTSKKQAIKYAKEAYKMCPECLDALILIVSLEKNALKREKLLNEGLKKEEERLKKEGFFDKENIGDFYGLFETRPYMRTLNFKADLFISEGKLTQAKEICKEILRLNKNDNTGARYFLMSIYASLEEEKEMLKLYNKYKEENLEMLIPLFVLYYKLGNDKKAIEYLKRINKANPHFVKFFKGTLKENSKVPEGYYSMGDSSEVIMYLQKFAFLFITIPAVQDYILENLK